MLESQRIKSLARETGFDLCGIARARRFDLNEEAFRRWLERGYDASLTYMRNHLDMRFDARRLVEGARTVVVCAVSYRSSVSEGYGAECRTRIASYACCRDYHKTIRKMLLKMLHTLQTANPALAGRVFVDSAPLLEKQAAVEAGLGWIGKQSLLITPGLGSFVLLGELVLCDEADRYDTPYTRNGCGDCRRCIDACPTGALTAPMTVDATRCISCHTVEAPPENEVDLHGWIFARIRPAVRPCGHRHRTMDRDERRGVRRTLRPHTPQTQRTRTPPPQCRTQCGDGNGGEAMTTAIPPPTTDGRAPQLGPVRIICRSRLRIISYPPRGRPSTRPNRCRAG